MTTTTAPLVRPAFAKASTVVFVLLLPFVAHVIWDYVESRRLNNRIDAIARSGAPTTVPRVFPLPPDADRASRYYRAAAVLSSGVPTYDASSEDVREALSLADRAAPLPFLGFAQFNYQIGGSFNVVRLCEARAMQLADAGDSDGAWLSLYAAVQVTRTFPTFFAIPRPASVKYVLERTHPSDAVRSRLLAAYAEVDRPDQVRRTLEGNRAARLEQLSIDLRRATTSVDGWFLRPWIMHNAVRMLDGRDEQMESFAKGIAKRAAQIHCEHQLVGGEVVNCSP